MIENHDENFEFNVFDIREEINDIFQPKEGEIVIDSQEKAEWVSGKIKIAYDKLKNIQETGEAKLKKLDEIMNREREIIISQMQEQQKPIENDIRRLWSRFGYQLRKFVELSLTKKQRSLKLAGMQIGFRKDRDRVIVENQDKLIDWALENNEALIVVPEVKPTVPQKKAEEYIKGEMKRLELVNKGKSEEEKEVLNVPDGVKLHTGEDKFFVQKDSVNLEILLGIGYGNPDEQNPEETGTMALLGDEEVPH